MKLYEVNHRIEQIIEEMVDTETGEIINESEELMERLHALEMERDRILEYLVKVVKNYEADETALKTEADRLTERRKRIEKRRKKVLEIIDRECAGIKKDLGIATVCYRKSTSIEIDDEKIALEWLANNGYEDCIKISAPVIRKDMTKSLITKGTEVPGVHLENHNNMSLK